MTALPRPRDWTAALLVALVAAAVLWAMGRVPICTCGEVRLWYGLANAPETSQHLTDWYSPSHVLHGLVFYAVLRWLRPGWPVGRMLLAATVVEATWEITENTDAVIRRYREATIALGYDGDSIVNSMADIAMMWIGFLVATRAPVWLSVALFVGAEVVTTLVIRDGLLLNVIMLLWPVDAIRAWQAGG